MRGECRLKKIICVILLCIVALLPGCANSAKRVSSENLSQYSSSQKDKRLFTGSVDYTIQPSGDYKAGDTIKVNFKFWQFSEYPFTSAIAKAKADSDVEYINTSGYDSTDKSKANCLFVFPEIRRESENYIVFKFVDSVKNVDFYFYDNDGKTPLYDVNGYALKCTVDCTEE